MLLILAFVGLLMGYGILAVALFRRWRRMGWGFLAVTLTAWFITALTTYIASASSVAVGVVVLPGAYVAMAIFLFSWRKWAGWFLLGITSIVALVCYLSTNVARHYDERMKYRLVKNEGESDVEVITSRGERFLVGSTVLAGRLRRSSNDTIRVSMSQTFDFGRMRSYEIHSVEGMDPYAP